MSTDLIKKAEMSVARQDEFESLWRIAKMCAGSGFFQDSKEASQACVKIQAGKELGFPPVVSMTQVYIVKGRVSTSASLMAAALRKAGYNYKLIRHDNTGCSIEFFDKTGNSLGLTEFTESDARTAGLLGGDNWKKYPRNMYFARAMSNGVRFFAPDALGGQSVYTPEELGADVDETGRPSVVTITNGHSTKAADLTAALSEPPTLDQGQTLDAVPEPTEAQWEEIRKETLRRQAEALKSEPEQATLLK